MIIGDKSQSVLNINSSFFSKKVGGESIETFQGLIIGDSGNPVQLNRDSLNKEYTNENLYLDFKTHPINGAISGSEIVSKGEFKINDALFHNPVLLFKDGKSAGINSDIVHFQPDYGNINIQIVEELVDNPTRFIVKISDFGGFYDGGRRKLYVENYVSVGGGVKILGAIRNVNSESDYEDKLQLRSTYEQSKVEYNSSSYFIPLALIDTDRKDFTVLY